MNVVMNSQQKMKGGDVTIRYARDEDAHAWDAFVFAAPGATFFHRFGWRNIFREIFRLDTHYLIAESERTITGVLPLVHQNSLFFGNTLSSLPFCAEGGPVATDIASRAMLDETAINLMRKLKTRSLEFRSRTSSRTGWTVRSGLYATFARDLSPNAEENLRAIPRKQRAVVRKTLQAGLSSRIDDNVDAFFRLYSESVRNLGTPVFSKCHFAALRASFGPDCDIMVVCEDAEPLSAVMNFYFRDTVMPYYAGGRRAARRNGANDFMYWEVMRRAADRGYRRFDFGRSKSETGAFAFKKNWGFEPQWLQYEYYLQPGAAIPEKNPNNPKYAALIALWKRLPLPVANLIGPFLVRGLG